MGPKGVGANIFFCEVQGFQQSPDWLPRNCLQTNRSTGNEDPDQSAQREAYWNERVREIEGSILTGFQMCTQNGVLHICMLVRESLISSSEKMVDSESFSPAFECCNKNGLKRSCRFHKKAVDVLCNAAEIECV